MILQRLKEKTLYKIIKRNVPLPPPVINGFDSVLFVVDAKRSTDFDTLRQLAKSIGIRNDKIFFVGFVERLQKGMEYSLPIVTSDNVDWKGRIKNNSVSFLPEKVDLLVNFYQDPSASLLAISFAVHAAFRVGVGENNLFNHLTVVAKDLHEKTFADEVFKYINILNKKQHAAN